MAENEENGEEFLRMFQEFLDGSGSFDLSELAGAAGLPQDPAMLAAMMSQMRAALNSSPSAAAESATQRASAVAAARQLPITDEERRAVAEAFQMAGLWLSEETDLTDPSDPGRVMNRVEWATGSLDAWRAIAEPISDSIGTTLVRALEDQAPAEMTATVSGASDMLRGLGKTLFAMQLGQVVGQLSTEVVSATEIGIPLFSDHRAALVPQNVTEFGRDLDVPADQVNIYLATRELAHTGLFRRARWLSLELVTAIREYSQGLGIDMDRMREAVDTIDLSDTSALRAAIGNGSLLSARTDAQLAALARIETLLALIEGWVDVVTTGATGRLPRAAALRETVVRRRASGGPAEQAFGALIGLELRPRRLREAAELWRRVGDELGSAARDALWQHPDLVPTSEEIASPEALIARLRAPAAPDDIDKDLERLLTGGFDSPGPDEPAAGGDPSDPGPSGPDRTP